MSPRLAALQAQAATHVPSPQVELWFEPAFHPTCGLLIGPGTAWWVAEVRREGAPLPLQGVTPTMSLEPGPWSEAEGHVLHGLLARVAAEQPKGLVLDGCRYWISDGQIDQQGNLAAAPAARALTRFVAALGSGPQRWRATRSAFSALARYAGQT